jgi:hypothetical protein
LGLNELKDMGRIIRELLFMKLASIEAVDEEPNRPIQSVNAAGKAARSASQTSQVVTQFGIISFDREGIGLCLRDFILTVVIPQAIIGIESITMVAFGFHRLIHHILYLRLSAFPDDFIPQKTARCPIYDRDDVDRLFFSPMKVNNSSISATLTASGTGAGGKLLTFALTHSETVRWWTPKCRAIRRRLIPSTYNSRAF